MKFKIWLYNIIDVMRAIPFDITNEFCRCDFWWDGDCQMYMIFNTTNRMNKSIHILCLRCNSAI